LGPLGTLGHRTVLSRWLDRSLSATLFRMARLAPARVRPALLDQAVRSNDRHWEALLHYLYTEPTAAGSEATENGVSRLLYEAANLRRRHPALFARDAVAFGDFLYRHAPLTCAQIYQDLWVLFELKEKRGGFFVEFGATDGVAMSNTLLLERDYGWTGILAEPNPVWHACLERNRRVSIAKVAVGPVSAPAVAFAATESPEIAGLKAYAGLDRLARHRADSPEISVEALSLNDLLDRHDAPSPIDFISIDTEGSELAILQNFDFKRWQVRTFCIEHNFAPARDAIHRLLTANGYRRRFPQYSMFDDWYAAMG
jgi:FkbM family methyltransferase